MEAVRSEEALQRLGVKTVLWIESYLVNVQLSDRNDPYHVQMSVQMVCSSTGVNA